MANFKTHLAAGGIFSVVAVSMCWEYGFISNIGDAIIAGMLAIVGSVLPDVDAERSIPTRIIISILSFLSVGIVLTSMHYLGGPLHIGVQSGICILTYLSVKYLTPKIISSITHHRGLIHSVPMAALLSLLLVSYLTNLGYEINVAILIGSFLGAGFLIHLILDEIYSVDILNAEIKSSFGSALQIFSFSQPIRYLALYLLAGYVYFNFLYPKLNF